MKLAALICVPLLVALRPVPAEACSCRGPRVAAAIRKTAPTNTHVMLWFSDVEYKTTPAFTLRPVGSKSAVALDRHDAKAGSFTVAKLVPSQPLRAKTAYEVVDDAGKQILAFTTTAAQDTKAPEWPGVKHAGYIQRPGGCCMCHTGEPYVRMDIGEVSDDHGAESVVFAVWTADAGKAIDYKQPPTYVRTFERQLNLGDFSTCVSRNFDLPEGKQLRIGVRPVDLAGNLGTASERELDLSRAPMRVPQRDR